jgi:hypothetical protein
MKTASYLEIERPDRWAKQLLSHLANKSELEGTTLKFGFGATGTVVTSASAIVLVAEASNQEALERAQEVLTKHLYRFAKIEDQVAKWYNID